MATIRSALKPFRLGRAAKVIWDALPHWLIDTSALRHTGHFIYDHFTRHNDRVQSHMTFFLRNVPQMQVVRDLISRLPDGAPLKIASLGCSSGAELYSFLYVIRAARRDLQVEAVGIDISRDITDIARSAVYDTRPGARDNVVVPAYGIDDPGRYLASLDVLLESTEDGRMRVKDWVREGTRWEVGDATDPALVDRLGPQDIVLANNFLGPMDDDLAETCLRNIVRLVKPGGVLVVDGVDLDLKARLVPQLGFEAITERMQEIHHADPTKANWPWTRWSHEPFDNRRTDRDFRYATIFRKPGSGH